MSAKPPLLLHPREFNSLSRAIKNRLRKHYLLELRPNERARLGFPMRIVQKDGALTIDWKRKPDSPPLK